MLWAQAASECGVNPPLEGFQVKAHPSGNIIPSVLFIKTHSHILKAFPRLKASHTLQALLSQNSYAQGSGLAVSQEWNGEKLYFFPFSCFPPLYPGQDFSLTLPSYCCRCWNPALSQFALLGVSIALPIHKNWNFSWIYALKFPSSVAIEEFRDEVQQQNNEDTSHCLCTAHGIPLSSGQEGKSRGWGTGKGTMSSASVFVFSFPLLNSARIDICATVADSSQCNSYVH